MTGLLALLLGALAATGQAPLDAWIIAFLAFAAFGFLLPQSARPFRTGWLFGLGYFGAALHWIVEPFLVDVQTYGWMAPFALILMAGGLALFWALAAWLSKWGQARPYPLVWALALSALEVVRGYIFTGFPWATPGYALLDTPHAQIAQFIGVYGLSTLFLVASVLPVIAWKSTSVQRWVALGFGGVLLLVPLAMPGTSEVETLDQNATKRVRILQPNVPQDEKWDKDKRGVHFERMISFSAAQGQPDLIVWPETAVTTWLDLADEELLRMRQASGAAEVIFGVQSFVAGRYFNSLATLTPDSLLPHQVYNKAHLVPFGEYMPFAKTLKRLGLTRFATNDVEGFSAGEGPRVLTLPNVGAFQPLICYEGIFPQFVNRAPERPAFLVLITNDGWFGDWAGPHQHLAKARMRSIEQGLPMLRAANTGISAVIDGQGQITTSLALNETGFLDAPLPPPFPATLYSRWGDTPLLAFFCLTGLALSLARRKGPIDASTKGL